MRPPTIELRAERDPALEPQPRFGHMRVFGRLALVLPCLVAGCASVPEPAEEPALLDERALRSCLMGKIPLDLLHDPKVQRNSVSLELTVLPSGRIESVAIVSGSGNGALDKYLADRLVDSRCAPFARMDWSDPYVVGLDLDLDVGSRK